VAAEQRLTKIGLATEVDSNELKQIVHRVDLLEFAFD
jgi:hypothetical protein